MLVVLHSCLRRELLQDSVGCVRRAGDSANPRHHENHPHLRSRQYRGSIQHDAKQIFHSINNHLSIGFLRSFVKQIKFSFLEYSPSSFSQGTSTEPLSPYDNVSIASSLEASSHQSPIRPRAPSWHTRWRHLMKCQASHHFDKPGRRGRLAVWRSWTRESPPSQTPPAARTAQLQHCRFAHTTNSFLFWEQLFGFKTTLHTCLCRVPSPMTQTFSLSRS